MEDSANFIQLERGGAPKDSKNETNRIAKEARLAEKKSKKAALKAQSTPVEESSKKRKRAEVQDDDKEASMKAEKKARKADKAKKAALKLEKDHNAAEPEELNTEKSTSSKKRKHIEECVEEAVGDDEAKALREKQERKKAKKAKKAAKAQGVDAIVDDVLPDPVKSETVEDEDDTSKAAREKRARKEARKAEKSNKKKHAEGNDNKVDCDVVESGTKSKANAKDIKVVVSSVDQWNPDALAGDDARKSKFMRLLGAGKGKADISKKPKVETAAKKTAEQISRVQSELERQYEMGMKMKHDGGSKRRGLGA